MATKKTNSKAPVKQQKRSTPSISARIDRLVDYENSKVKAIASVNIGGAFAIHGLRVIDSQKRGRITIPFEIRQRVGFSYNDILSFTEAPDGRTVIVKREKICDNCAAEKPQKKGAEDTITLFDFLNGLSDEQQKAAFAHLKLKWDRVQGSGLYGRS